MSTVVKLDIKPKSIDGVHEGQRYTCSYDPNAPSERSWVWVVRFTQTYNFVGNAPTQHLAERRARSKIRMLNGESQLAEERSV